MSTLLLKFKIELESSPIRSGLLYTSGLFGPQFHRWSPEGEKDAISLNLSDPDVTLKVWFERFGFVDGNLIKFDYTRQEIDLEILAQQGRVEGGPLFALLKIENLSQENVVAVQEGDYGSDHYKSLEKRVIKLFYPPIISFLQVLRARYGQYWIPEIERWDSRIESASSYLRRYGFPVYRIDSDLNWKSFASNSLRLSVAGLRKQPDFSEYITNADWQEIKILVQQNTIASPAVSKMIEAVDLFDRGYTRHAIIDAVTALEIGLGEALREILSDELEAMDSLGDFPFWVQILLTMSMGESLLARTKEEIKRKIFSTFFTLKLERQFEVIWSVRQIAHRDREATLRLIDIRNAIVHEGKGLPSDVKSLFSGVLNALTTMLPSQKLRFPLAHAGNQIIPPEK